MGPRTLLEFGQRIRAMGQQGRPQIPAAVELPGERQRLVQRLDGVNPRSAELLLLHAGNYDHVVSLRALSKEVADKRADGKVLPQGPSGW